MNIDLADPTVDPKELLKDFLRWNLQRTQLAFDKPSFWRICVNEWTDLGHQDQIIVDILIRAWELTGLIKRDEKISNVYTFVNIDDLLVEINRVEFTSISRRRNERSTTP